MKEDKVIAYACDSLNPMRKSYPTRDLDGITYKIYIDHQSLQYIFTYKELNLRQQQWLELLKDYNLEIEYHPGKANVVADALSKNIQHGLNTIIITQPYVFRDLKCLGVELVSHGQANAQLLALEVQPPIIEEIKLHQKDDVKLQRIRQNLERGKSPSFVVHEDGTLRFQNQLCA